MSGEPFSVAHLYGVTAGPGVEGSTWLQVRRHFGIGAVGVNAYRASAGGRVIEDHDELGTTAGRHEELYLVVSGRARFAIGDEEVDAPAGTLVFVPPETRRGAFAEEDGTTVLVLGGKPGEPFTVSPWEEAADAWWAYEAKDYERAIELYEEVLVKHPGAAGMLFNLACCEALAGRGDSAIQHLEQAAEIDERFRAYAADDSDFDPIRGDPRFAALLTSRPEA
jgi:mannose-6-phosphate isomerase-like protein (cupin superfamily)